MPSSLGNKNKYHNHSLELPHNWGLSASAQDPAVSSSYPSCTTTDGSIFRWRGVGTWWEEPYLACQCTQFRTASEQFFWSAKEALQLSIFKTSDLHFFIFRCIENHSISQTSWLLFSSFVECSVLTLQRPQNAVSLKKLVPITCCQL